MKTRIGMDKPEPKRVRFVREIPNYKQWGVLRTESIEMTREQENLHFSY